MADITFQSILDFKNIIEKSGKIEGSLTEDSLIYDDYLNGIVYLLGENKIKITWRELDKKLEIIIRKNSHGSNPFYKDFIGIFASGSPDTASSWEEYFDWLPTRMNCNLGQNRRGQEEISFLESDGWPKFKQMIEKYVSPRLKSHPEEIEKICVIANDLTRTLKDQKMRNKKSRTDKPKQKSPRRV
ncbi:MAG: hypothetical protein A2909_01670 [Candidatus Tagabacteria bacterium RIFCSPLOWO2_01_FULL_39_11]|uniref:Uncharacterized protein n=1 Tax=Candidatus Tagabacteria bacterium RIFCSPLOWO2_01_FULL_39_11 TaxID=1802295 RepID=A0A1G2LQT8_9BACT|nr:MAG: hypothetical protein A2909_01670 [Candidatus Tagabacteria bacterium RIFCSPLOWO2_01_FULL_39_11]